MMSRISRFTALALSVPLLAVVQAGGIVRASGGNNSVQTVALHAQACAASSTGPVVGTARFSLDDQGGGNLNPNGIEIRVSVSAGQSRTSYGVTVVDAACHVLATGGTLVTDDSGRGDQEFHVLGSLVPPGTNVRVTLSASTNALTSDLVSAP